MPTVNLSPVFVDAQFINGIPAVGAQIFTYIGGTSSKVSTYTASGGAAPNTNPIILNSRGEPPQGIWIPEGSSVKFVFANPGDTDPPQNPIRTIDYVVGVGTSTGSGTGGISGINSDDTQMIAIDYTNPDIPLLDIKSNTPNGIPKLDATGKIPLAQLPTIAQSTMADTVNDNGVGATLSFWFGSEAQYTAIVTKSATTVYLRSA